MFESYLLTTDGKEYVDVNSVREALGIGEESDIFEWIAFLKKSNERSHSEMYKARGEKHEFEKEIREALGTVDEYADLIGIVRKLKEERDELKEKCDKLKKRTNAVYGVSCGYSGNKAPAFRCNVISYSWNFGLIAAHSLMDEPSYPISSDSIRVELDLTPTANYKGTFDLEDLKHYIQAYGREKLGIIESVDYQNAKAARAELAYLYKQVLGKERLDRNLSPHEIMKAIHDEYKRVVHNFEERTADWSKAQKELDRYRLAVGSLLDIPKDARDDINAIERSFTFSKKKYESLKEFRDNVCEILDIPSSMADNYVLKEIHDIADRYDELEDFRADICGILDIEGMLGTPQQNDQYILGQAEKLKDGITSLDRYARFRSNICTALCLGGETDDEDILKRVRMTKECHDALCKDYTELRKAIWEAMDRKPETLPDETARLVGEVRMLQLNYVPLKRLHDEVAKAIGMDRPATDNIILHNVRYIYKDRADAYGMVASLNDHIKELEKAKEDLQKDYDSLGKAYSSVLKWNNSYTEVRRLLGVSADADADEMVDTLDQLVCERERCKRRYENWYSRYESEHRRANGEHKRAEKLKNEVKCWTKRCDSLQTALNNSQNDGVALQAFRNECKKLRDEKSKVISALGQEIWDDCLE